MGQSILKSGPGKICGRQPLKNFTWSILEYFAPNDIIQALPNSHTYLYEDDTVFLSTYGRYRN